VQWFYDNYKWLFDGIGAIVFIGVITFLWRRLVSTPAAQAPAPDSHPSNSAVASGNVTNIYNVQPHAPTPVVMPITPIPDIAVPKTSREED
jgi:hypothetical protein